MSSLRVNVGAVVKRNRDEDFVQNFINRTVNLFQRNYGFIIADISLFDPQSAKYQFLPATIFTPQEWAKVLGIFNCKGFNKDVFDKRKQTFEEYSDFFCAYLEAANILGLYGVVISIDLTTDSARLAQIINSCCQDSNLKFWFKIYITRAEIKSWLAADKPTSLDIWHKWKEISLLINNTQNIGVCLEFSEVPEGDLSRLQRWFFEPLKCIFLSGKLFEQVPKLKQLCLPQFINDVLAQAWKGKSAVALTSMNDDLCDEYFFELSRLFQNLPAQSSLEDFSSRVENMLNEPLQPLRDNLTSEIYSVFEMDSKKYQLYSEAFLLALQALVKLRREAKESNESGSKRQPAHSSHFEDDNDEMEAEEEDDEQPPIVVAILGAGRGPLVSAMIQVAEELDVEIELFVLEKNRFIIPTLMYLNQSEWNGAAKIFIGDIRTWDPPKKINIMASELLGSFGDNELSPEILDLAQRYLADEGIMIPQSSTSFIAPVQNQSVYSSVVSHSTNILTHCTDGASFEKPYVVYSSKSRHIDQPKTVFKFEHPNTSFTPEYNMYKCLKFKASDDCILHFFEGYFSSVLADQVIMSTEPQTHSENMFSWFPIVFPLKIPVQVSKGQEIEFHIWRRNDNARVWYEWTITKPIVLPIHNTNGNHYKMHL